MRTLNAQWLCWWLSPEWLMAVGPPTKLMSGERSWPVPIQQTVLNLLMHITAKVLQCSYHNELFCYLNNRDLYFSFHVAVSYWSIFKFHLLLVAGTGPGYHFVCGLGLGRLVTGIVGLNPARGMDVCLCASVLCCPAWVEAFATGWARVQRSPNKCLNPLKTKLV
jgi:hypothetical protein